MTAMGPGVRDWGRLLLTMTAVLTLPMRPPGEDPQVFHPSLPEAHRDPPRKPQPPAWLLLLGGGRRPSPSLRF